MWLQYFLSHPYLPRGQLYSVVETHYPGAGTMYTQVPNLEAWKYNDTVFYYGVLYILVYLGVVLFLVMCVRLIALKGAWEAFWRSGKPEAEASLLLCIFRLCLLLLLSFLIVFFLAYVVANL